MFQANDRRYEKMRYKRAGNSGVKLPYISLGMWQNFGSQSPYDKSREMALGAFDLGITHFDLANNYGPAPGSAERTLGRILQEDLHSYRDELFISTKAGYTMWEGPYGDWGSGKSMLASLDQSLKRMGLDYVDLFYSHRPGHPAGGDHGRPGTGCPLRQGAVCGHLQLQPGENRAGG